MSVDLMKKTLEEFREATLAAAKAESKPELERLNQEIVKLGEQLSRMVVSAPQAIHGGDEATRSTKKLDLQMRAILKAVSGNEDKAELRDLEIGTGTSGGYLVPEEFMNRVMMQAAKSEVVAPNAMLFSGVGPKGNMPALGTEPTMSMVAEGGAITPATGANIVAQVAWALKEAAALIPMSRQIASAPGVDVVNLLSIIFGRAYAKLRNTQFTTGTGLTIYPQGFTVAVGGENTVAQAGAALTSDDVIDAFFALPSQFRLTAVWQMNNAALKLVAKLKDGEGRPLYLRADQLANVGGLPPTLVGTLLGRPVFENEDIAGAGTAADKTVIHFCDLQNGFVVFDGGPLEIATSDQYLFNKNQLAVRAVGNIDSKKVFGSSFANLTGVYA